MYVYNGNMKTKTISLRDNFKCIGGACSFTCCKEWSIAVDDYSLARWNSIYLAGQEKPLSFYVNKGKGSMKLFQNRCPFLNQDNLCQMVVEHGETVLCHTCDTFPRQNLFFVDQAEYGGMNICPVVIDLLRDTAITFSDGEQCSGIPETEETEDLELLRGLRDRMIEFLLSGQYDLGTSLRMLFYMMLDVEENYYADADWKIDWDTYFSEQALGELAEEIGTLEADAESAFLERNELLLDLCINYERQGYYKERFARFLPLAKEISRSKRLPEQEKCEAFETIWDSYQSLLRNFLVNEIFTNLLKPQSDMQSITVMLQWTAMEYAMICHVAFLEFMECGELSYEALRDILILIGRMTGYDEDDIFDYLEDSFEELLWPFAYLHQILPLEKRAR